MQLLIDCDILHYCFSSAQERTEVFDLAVGNLFKPVYQLPVFELCRAVHLLVKHHRVSPRAFRACWSQLSNVHLQSGEYFIHMHELGENELLGEIIRLSRDLPGEDAPVPCEDLAIYWGHNKHLVHRIRSIHKVQMLQSGWLAVPPECSPECPPIRQATCQDVILDTNNLIELLQQLPADGFLTGVDALHFPDRLSEQVRRDFRSIIATYGAARHFIIPMSVLEESQWVINKPANKIKYGNAREVLSSILLDPERPLWQIFRFEATTQEIFEYFLLIYETLEQHRISFDDFDDFGDLLVLAHALYHGAQIASNEWFEGPSDVWDRVRECFPFLVMEWDKMR